MNEKIRINEVAKMLGVSAQTLRNWDKSGKLQAERSSGKQRYYFLEDLKRFALDIQALGLAWAISSMPPELPSEHYCERSDRFTSRVARMGTELQTNHLSLELASLITLVASEIGDNSFAHNVGNWPDVPGIFFGYNEDKRVIVLADRGLGVRATLLRVRPDIKDDMEALKVAFTERISGRAPEQRGNGLKFVRNVAVENPVGVYLQSGTAFANIAKTKGSLEINLADRNIRGVIAKIVY